MKVQINKMSNPFYEEIREVNTIEELINISKDYNNCEIITGRYACLFDKPNKTGNIIEMLVTIDDINS